MRARIVAARKRLPDIQVPDSALERAAQLCMGLGTDGLRGELTLIRAARALASVSSSGSRRRRWATTRSTASPSRRCATACAATRWTTPMPARVSSASAPKSSAREHAG